MYCTMGKPQVIGRDHIVVRERICGSKNVARAVAVEAYVACAPL